MDNPDNPRERPSCHISERPDKGVHTPRQDLVFLMGIRKEHFPLPKRCWIRIQKIANNLHVDSANAEKKTALIIHENES